MSRQQIALLFMLFCGAFMLLWAVVGGGAGGASFSSLLLEESVIDRKDIDTVAAHFNRHTAGEHFALAITGCLMVTLSLFALRNHSDDRHP